MRKRPGEGFAFFRWAALTFPPMNMTPWRGWLRERRILYWWQVGLR